MNKNKNETPRTEETLNEEIARETWDNWVGELEDKDQPSCNIDNADDCEACGS
jgi:hypothetical protein|tara:strand:- start:5806 stop:5964 length:159 start_codon:yes stop_codon:yes gene_type:complete